MMYIMMDLAFTILLVLPVVAIHWLMKERKQKYYQAVSYFMIFQIITLDYMLAFGESYWLVLGGQLLFGWPVFIFWYEQTSSKQERQKHLKKLGVIAGVCLVTVLLAGMQIKGDVTEAHEQFMAGLAGAEEPYRYIALYAVDSASVVSLVEELALVRSGNVRTTMAPWKSTVFVKTEKKSWEFTYVRFYDGWVLEGNPTSTIWSKE